MSRLSQLVDSRERHIVTAEFPSIDGGGLDAVRERLEPLVPYVDAINATDNPAAHAHASNVSIAIALATLGAEPILQVVCRDRNRIAQQADIIGAALFGVENICALTGDDVTPRTFLIGPVVCFRRAVCQRGPSRLKREGPRERDTETDRQTDK